MPAARPPSRARPPSFAIAPLLLASALLTAPALAEPSPEELTAARQLFDEGKALEQRKDWAEALKRFRKVAAVRTTPQVRFHIAFCEEHLGHLVEAINGFEQAHEEARRAGPSAAEVERNAPPRARALRKRVAAVTLHVKGTLRTSRIHLDGKPIPPLLFGSEIPVDPGAHTVTAERDRETIFSQDLTLKPRGRATVTIPIDDPELPATPEPTAAVPPPEPEPPPAPLPPPPPPPPPPSRAPAYVTGGIGLAALAGAGVFFGLREAAFSEVRATCTDDIACDPALRDRFEQGKTFTTVSVVLGAAGVAALTTAGILWITLTPATEPTPPPVSLRLAPTPNGALLLGTF
ncbi:tetratricopeptide repeat protein [Chondromyces apiculatus]|uniref:PEGA domain-containing protein n=1 Tax=Chondromyces apiculatus DSM 436 TaxID=1192034 RepID=A0A017TGT5_9BACT|nr:hypothetical protein [Chondromyces apiculatus]EYF08117.1 Hypothetical protein CAP_5877 [Chondromyces apiculatus DSM 436]